MKILFLDVDGVLNNYKTGGLFTISKSKLRLLSYIVNNTNCEIVLSSTWRLNVMGELDVLKKRLWYRKLTIKDVTPRFNSIRGEEIQYWLKHNEGVTSWCILDDSDDMLDDQRLNFVHTNGLIGMTKEDADKVIEILGKG